MDISQFEYEQDMEYAARYVLENEVLSGPAEGIAKQVIDKGWDSLSERQKDVFQKYVIPLATKKCEFCEAPIPYSELDSFEGMCGYCAYKWNKIKEE